MSPHQMFVFFLFLSSKMFTQLFTTHLSHFKSLPLCSQQQWRKLTVPRLYTEKVGEQWVPSVAAVKEHFAREGRLSTAAALRLLHDVGAILRAEPNILQLAAPTVVVGDVHGQYYDLLQVIDQRPADTQYLFLGDYVDRGCFGTEICFLLFAMKIARTFAAQQQQQQQQGQQEQQEQQEQNQQQGTGGGVWLLRGNHECRLMTAHFNFKQECLTKYNAEVYCAFMDVFDALPLAATVATRLGTFLCIHGGLGPSLTRMSDLEAIHRFTEPPSDGPLCDLLWSDPAEEETGEGLDEADMKAWLAARYVENPTRGCGYVFGYAAVRDFCDSNGLVSVVRGHEVKRTGYHLHRFFQPASVRAQPLTVTVFSAPNYCDIYGNVGAVMELGRDGYAFACYESVPHPQWMPHFETAFDLTLMILSRTVLLWVKRAMVAIKEEMRRAKRHSASLASMRAAAAPRRASSRSPSPSAPAPASLSLPGSPAESPAGSPPGTRNVVRRRTGSEAGSGIGAVVGHGSSSSSSSSSSASSSATSSPKTATTTTRGGRTTTGTAATTGTTTPPTTTTTTQESSASGSETGSGSGSSGHSASSDSGVALRPRRGSIACIAPGTVVSRINEFGQIERTNLDSAAAAGVSWTPEQQTSLQGVFGRSRELLLSKAVAPFVAPPTTVFETARCADHENERRPPISELKKFFEEYRRSRYQFTYTDAEGVFFIGPDGTAAPKKAYVPKSRAAAPSAAAAAAASSSSSSSLSSSSPSPSPSPPPPSHSSRV